MGVPSGNCWDFGGKEGFLVSKFLTCVGVEGAERVCSALRVVNRIRAV
jgi:hypothetical protein